MLNCGFLRVYAQQWYMHNILLTHVLVVSGFLGFSILFSVAAV